MPDQPQSLSAEALGYLRYLHSVLTQPLGEWEGFYPSQSASMNFALRYQIAFATYAVALLSTRTPAYRAPHVEAMRAAVEKMLHPAAWSYWRVPETASTPVGHGHVAVLTGPHQSAAPGAPSDPIRHNNLQYSGHLSTMLGLYEAVSGDRRYDEPFDLHDPESGARFTYTHTGVAGSIHAQMRENRFGGVCCEPGMAYVPCNNYAMASNALHDALHGTRMSKANAGWLQTVRRKMVLHGPPMRGIFGASYVKDLHMAAPVAFNFTDAWGLAFMLPFERELARKLYRKFRRKIERTEEGAFVGSSTLSERMEISDVAVNSGFGAILARGLGDGAVYNALRKGARNRFGAGWVEDRYFLKDAARSLHATSLFALAEAAEPGGDNFTRLFTGAVEPFNTATPHISRLEDQGSAVGVSRASYDPQTRTLHFGLRHAGPPQKRGGAEVGLMVDGVGEGVRVEVGDEPYLGEIFRMGERSVRFSVPVTYAGETTGRVLLD
jgi:hypothetical protein